MDPSDSDVTVSGEGGSGISRRDAIKKGAVVGGAVVWATPVIQAIGVSPAGAQVASPVPGCACTGTASFDARATLTGLISGTIGPIQNFPDENGCLATVELRGPGLLAQPFLTAETVCVGGTTAGGTCSATVSLENLAVDLSELDPLLDVQLDLSAVSASASCTCAGGCTAEACLAQTGDTILVVAGQTLMVGSTEICNDEQTFNINVAGITGTITLLSTSENPCQATVAHINVSIPNIQTVDLVIARATAVCTPT